MHEPLTNMRKVIALIFERDMPTTEVWRAMYGAACCTARRASSSSRSTTTSTRQRRRAVLGDVVPLQRRPRHPHAAASRPGPRPAQPAQRREDASVLIDATLKEDFPPISLPKREYMERAQDLGGARPAEAQARSRRGSAIRSANGARNSTRWRSARCAATISTMRTRSEAPAQSDVGMNTEVRRVDEGAPKSRPKSRR